MRKIILIAAFIAVLVAVAGICVIKNGNIAAVFTPQEEISSEPALDRIKRTNTIRCGYVAGSPFYFKDPISGKLVGFFKELSDAVLALSKWKIDYIMIAAETEAQDLNSGKVDAICGTGPWYLSALHDVSFTKPWANAAAFVYGRDDEHRFAAPEQMNKSDILFVGINGDVSIDLAQRYFPKASVQALPSNTDSAQMFAMVTTRKEDATITDPISVKDFNRISDDKLKALFPDQPVAIYGMGFAVRQEDVTLLQALDGFGATALQTNLISPVLKKYDPDKTLFLPVTYADTQPAAK